VTSWACVQVWRRGGQIGASRIIRADCAVKIYTRTGDEGETSLFDQQRVSKADPRVEAYGDIDELNAWLGLLRAGRLASDLDETVVRIQRDLFAVGAQLADPADRLAARTTKAFITDDDVARLEAAIDRFETEVPPLTKFILPGGAAAGASMHVARTVCRRAERRMVGLTPPTDAVLIRYINRLSDLLFVLARVVNHRVEQPETEW
jgi:cob(I)alamin adenosyltransferase